MVVFLRVVAAVVGRWTVRLVIRFGVVLVTRRNPHAVVVDTSGRRLVHERRTVVVAVSGSVLRRTVVVAVAGRVLDRTVVVAIWWWASVWWRDVGVVV